jgi:hypothetical protein
MIYSNLSRSKSARVFGAMERAPDSRHFLFIIIFYFIEMLNLTLNIAAWQAFSA